MTPRPPPATPAFAALLRPDEHYDDAAAASVRRERHRRVLLSALRNEPIDLSHASVRELARLPGIGPRRARQILALRQRGALLRVEDLVKIRGIGPRTVETVRPYVVVSVVT